jgi:hypothetical protein
MKILVNVTPADIAQGISGFKENCAVALALRRTLDATEGCEGRYVSVGDESLDACGRSYPLPESVETFVRRFDAGMPVEPFSFTVELDG